MACDPFILYKSVKDAPSGAMSAFKTVDANSIKGLLAAVDPAALAAMATSKGVTLPPGVNAAEFFAKVKANPALALAALPKGVNPAVFLSLLG
jgi:hypothetical protein